MKTAILISGQSRLPINHTNFIEDTIEPNEPCDVYVVTWDEPPWSDYVLRDYKPVSYKLVPTGKFMELKQDFWSKYSSIADKEVVSERKAFLNGEIGRSLSLITGRYCDNVLRMFYMNYTGSNLIGDNYDCIIKLRPDGLVNKTFTYNDLGEGAIGSSAFKVEEPRLLMDDGAFWGRSKEMKTVLGLWEHLPVFMSEIIDVKFQSSRSRRRRPGEWLSPENRLRDWIVYNGLRVIPVDIRFGKFYREHWLQGEKVKIT